MDRSVIGVFSEDRGLAAVLRQRCPMWDFTEGAEGAVLAIVDGQGASGYVGARIVLRDGTSTDPRELCLPRELFLASPEAYISFALTAARAADAERELHALQQVHDLMSLTDAEAVSERITKSLLSLSNLRYGTLYLHDPKVERYVASFSNDESVRDTGEFLPGVPPEVLQRALTSTSRVAVERKASGAGMIIMPLQVGDDLLGVVKLALSKDDAFDESTVPTLSRYIIAVTHVVSNVYQLTRSRDLAMLDDLTKAFNRRFFDSYLDEELERSRRYGAQMSIIFLDLDDLKAVNNAYGHLSGSRTLQEVAKRILGAVRTIDKVVRFGGDEFCIILPQTDQDQALLVANRVRRAMSAAPYELQPGVEISISASFGVATYPSHAMAKDDLIRLADAAMYRVKSTTKNAVGIASQADALRPAAT
jgi:diguanylate cyclase (GGDEF)-like protein